MKKELTEQLIDSNSIQSKLKPDHSHSWHETEPTCLYDQQKGLSWHLNLG